MALNAATQWMFRPAATANMVNGGGFNTANANFLSDCTVDAGTGNTATPVLSSASYNFVVADVGAWIFVKAGTNWTPGFYQITAIPGNSALINAAIGAGRIFNPISGRYDTPNTVAGIATVGTPTGGTVGVDYSQADAANSSSVNFATASGGSSILTCVDGNFRKTHAGNFIHLTTTGTGNALVGWYEIISVTDSAIVTVDRTTNNGAIYTGATGYLGGALDLAGALPNTFFGVVVPGNIVWMKGGSYTLGSAISGPGSQTNLLPVYVIGFTSLCGDACDGANRPLIAGGASDLRFGPYTYAYNLIFTGTGSLGFFVDVNSRAYNCKSTNTSTTASRPAFRIYGGGAIINCEAVSQNGYGIYANDGLGPLDYISGCYAHDSNIGIIVGSSSNSAQVLWSIVADNVANAIYSNTATSLGVANCILYGAEAKLGVGIRLPNADVKQVFTGNIIYGFVTGIAGTTQKYSDNFGAYNDFYNNTTDASLYNKDKTDIATNPAFTSVSQITGTNATTSGSVLTSSGADFSAVTDNQDYCYISAGTGKSPGKYLITNHTSNTLTLNNAPGTNATADGVFSVTIGHNFKPTVALAGYPGTFPGALTVGGAQIGAVQRAFAAPAAAVPISSGCSG
jgi:hypothetical protein